MSFNRIRSIDLETTDLPEDGGRICEIGWYDILLDDGEIKLFPDHDSALINPQILMPSKAKAVHHITDQMLADATKNADEMMRSVLSKADVLVAHKADFEQAFIHTNLPWICTYKVARHLYPHFDQFTVQYLRYRLELDLDQSKAMPAHRAGPDAYVAGHLFVEFLKQMTVEEMIDISQQQVLLYRCHLRKHKSKIWEEIAQSDPSYLQWIIGDNSDFKPSDEVYHTANHWLRRAG